LNIIKALFKRIPKTGLYLNERDPDLGFRTVPQIVVADEELLIFIAQKIGDFPKGQDDVCFWTNCNTLVQSFSTVFEELWRNSKNVKEKNAEIKTGCQEPAFSMIRKPPIKSFMRFCVLPKNISS